MDFYKHKPTPVGVVFETRGNYPHRVQWIVIGESTAPWGGRMFRVERFNAGNKQEPPGTVRHISSLVFEGFGPFPTYRRVS